MKTKKELELAKIALEYKMKQIDLEIKYFNEGEKKIGFKI